MTSGPRRSKRGKDVHRTGIAIDPVGRKTLSTAEGYRHIDPSIKLRRRYLLCPHAITLHHPARAPTAAVSAAQRRIALNWE